MSAERLRWRDLAARQARNDLPYLVGHHWIHIHPDDRAEALTAAWTMAEFPENHVEAAGWVTLFDWTGYLVDGKPTDRNKDLPEVVTLYRGSTHARRSGMSWTGTLEHARWFADRFAGMTNGLPTQVWRIEIPREYVLAHFTCRGEDEYVVDTSTFDGDEYLPA